MDVNVFGNNVGLIAGILFSVISIVFISKQPKEEPDLEEPIKHHYRFVIKK